MTEAAPPNAFRNAFDQLHEVVSAATGLSDFGPDDYHAGLTLLLHSMDYDPQFSDAGRAKAWAMLVDVLRGRAEAYAAMAAHPHYAAAKVTAPVIITGVPRTGTTALHRLMAEDDRFQGLESWLLDSPKPRPPRDTWGDDPAFQRTFANLAAHYADKPDAKAAHFRAAEEVHECCMVMRQSFTSNLWTCGWSAGSYDSWWQGQDEANAYAHLAKCVRLIGLNDPDKRWLLKNPGHIEHLDQLFAIFPDAKVIQTHRDPAKAVPSLVSLLMKGNAVMEPARVEQRRAILMRREVAKWAEAVRKSAAVEANHQGQVRHITHADFHRDPMGVLNQIYAFIGMEMTDLARTAMQARSDAKPELSRGAHRYAITDFGMTEDEARAPFAEYIARHGLMEGRA